MPEGRRFLFFTLALPTSTGGNNAEEAAEEIKPFFQFVFYTIDRIKRFRLSREVNFFKSIKLQFTFEYVWDEGEKDKI